MYKYILTEAWGSVPPSYTKHKPPIWVFVWMTAVRKIDTLHYNYYYYYYAATEG